MSPSHAGIYAIEHLASGMRYIGSAVNIRKRWEIHRHYLHNGTHHCQHLQRAWEKYGADAFAWRVIEVVADVHMLIQREQYWINHYRATSPTTLYNASPTAGSCLGRKQSPEERQKHAEAARKRPPHSAETRAKISRAKTGVRLSDAARANISAALRRRERTSETGERIRAAMQGKPFSDAHRAALGAAKKGKPWTPRQRAVLSQAHAEREMSDQHRAAISQRHRGERNHWAKLTEGDVREIRRQVAGGLPRKVVAAAFHVALSNIDMIVRRETWKHVPD